MIPFRDSAPSKRVPIVTVTLILINVLIFIREAGMGPQLETFIREYGVIPKKWFYLGKSPEVTLSSVILPYFTSIFLHGGWFHLASNMWYLWIFGDNIEDRLGHARFILFYIGAGILAGVVHTAFNPDSTLPAVGASGAIAGVLGAYFIHFPNSRIQTLIPVFYAYEIIELPAVVVLGMWFVMQLFSGTLSIAATVQSAGGVAWWAHIGGFISGIFLFSILSPSPKKNIDFRY